MRHARQLNANVFDDKRKDFENGKNTDTINKSILIQYPTRLSKRENEINTSKTIMDVSSNV